MNHEKNLCYAVQQPHGVGPLQVDPLHIEFSMTRQKCSILEDDHPVDVGNEPRCPQYDEKLNIEME